MFKPTVHRRRLNRREALGLGAAALAGGALRPRSGFAAAGTSLFELAVDEGAAHVAGWRTTRVLQAPRRFDLIGLRWARGGHLDAQVRARRRGGGWTPWMTLPPTGDHAPDGVRAPAGTEPAYTGAADVFQLRLRGSARGLRARFVRAQPTARTARSVTARLRRRARAAQSGPPAIITRSEWGGDSVPPRTAPEYGEVQAAFVHHTVNANDYAPEESAGIVLAIARYHRDSHRWNDLGYNFLVDKYGQVFEGRAGGIDQPVMGAQAQGYNSSSTGIACIGTFSAEPQSEPGLEALARLIGWKLTVHGVPTQGTVVVTSQGGASNRYPSGTLVTLERICGHRDGDATSCPGDALYAQLPDLRARAARYAGPLGGLTARASSTRVRSRPVRLSGRLSFPDGSSPAGAPLDIEFAVPGAAFSRIAGTVCGPDGTWSATVPVTMSGSVRAAFRGDGARGPLASSPIAIRVLPLLRLGLSSRRVRRGRAVAVSGTISPPPAGGRIEVRLERRVGRRWLRIQRKRIGVRGGRYLTRVRLRRAGLYRVSVITPGATQRGQVRVV